MNTPLDNATNRVWMRAALRGVLSLSSWDLSGPVGASTRLGYLVCALVIALVPSSGLAQCPRGWDISGEWALKQSNQAEPNAMSLSTNPKRAAFVHGSASYGTGSKQVTGRVKGSITGSDVFIEIAWSNGLTGIYEGKIGPQGKLEGTGHEARHPSKKVSWYSTRAMTCR